MLIVKVLKYYIDS